MLVLTRRPREAIYIGPDIEVVILAVDGERVRVGIEAPPIIPILRAEIAAKSLTDRPGWAKNVAMTPDTPQAAEP